jgi:WD40 repeat protein
VSPSAPQPTPPLPLDARRRIAHACIRFDEQWQAGGDRPRLEDFLPANAGPDERREWLRALLEVEIDCRRRAGESVPPGHYLDRFPDQADVVQAVFAAQPTPASGPPALPGYEILAELGRGGMGVVYQARHLQLGRVVALKMILAGAHAGEQDLLRFLGEAEAVAALQHPHVVQLFDFGRHDGLPYFTLEFVAGGSLADRLQGTPLPPGEAARLAEQLARGMAYAHEHGIVHRDLKPTNVLLAEDGTPKITDFGLAKRVEVGPGLTVSGAIVGTPSYMAPEQARGDAKRVGPAADVYALGAVLYECLTGRPPFRAAAVMDTLLQVIAEEPVPVRQFQPGVPADLETICLKCLQKEPPQRYSSAEALAEDLRRFLNNEPIRARPVGSWERAVKWARRRPAVAALLAGVILVTIIGGTGIVLNWQAAEKRAEETLEAYGREQQAKNDTQQAQAKAEAAEKETSRKNEQLRRQLYVLNVQEAARALTDNDTQKAETLLLACPPALRGWEWYYLLRQCRAELLTLDGQRVAFSPDGKRLLTALGTILETYDTETARHVGSVPLQAAAGLCTRLAPHPNGTQIALLLERVGGLKAEGKHEIGVWDLATGKRVRTFNGFATEVAAITLSPDGSRLAAGGGETSSVAAGKDKERGEVKVWDVGTGRLLLDVQQLRPVVRDVCFSPDGKRLAGAGQDGKIRLWDADTGQEVRTLTGHEGAVNAVAFSPDGDALVSGGADRLVRIWELRLDPPIVRTCRGHQSSVNAVAFSPDGARIASGGYDRAVKVWSQGGSEWATYRGHTSVVSSVTFSPDGSRLASSGDIDRVKLWDATAPPGSAAVHRGAGAFSPDWQRLVTTAPGRRLRVWDRTTGRLVVTTPGQQAGVADLAFRPDGKEFATAGDDGSVTTWDAAGGQRLRTFPSPAVARAVVYSPDGTRLAIRTADDVLKSTVRVLEAATGREVLAVQAERASGLVFSPDGKRLAIGGYPNHPAVVGIVDVATGRPLWQLIGHKSKILDLAWQGDRIATLSQDRSAKVWDPATGALQLDLSLGLPAASKFFDSGHIVFSPDGERLVASSDTYPGKVWVSELTEGKEVLALTSIGGPGPEFRRSPLFFSPDGQYLSVPGNSKWDENDSIHVLDGGRGALALALRGRQETGRWTTMAFSPDGQLLAGGETRASLWNAATGEELPPLPPFRDAVFALAFSPDSRRLAAVTVSVQPGHLGESEVQVWDVRGRKELVTFRGQGRIQDVAFAPDGRRLATAASRRPRDGEFTVKVWDARTGEAELTLTNEKAGFNGVAFSPDGTRLAAIDTGHRIRVWDSASGRPLFVCGPARGAGSGGRVAFSPDGRHLVATGGAVTVWDAATGKELRTLEGSPTDADRLAFSRDGKLLAAAAPDTVVLWDFASGREVSSYPLHGGPLLVDLAFSPDGTRLAIGNSGSLDIWEVGVKWQTPTAVRRRQARERVTAWHRQQALDLSGFAARFHCSWLIAREPNEGGHYVLRADANVALGRWDEAAADAARAVELLPDDPGTWERLVVLHLRAGNAAGYHETCAALLKRLGQTTDPAAASVVAWICCLAPGATSEPQAVVALAERAAGKEARADRLGTLGAALCRAGRAGEAVGRLRGAIKDHAQGGLPVAWFLLAIAHQHLRQPAEAREAYDRGRAQEKAVAAPTWQARLQVELLRSEAERLLQEKKP